ncbi:MAG: 50S ribosomal protein L6 [Cytophagales bacterium]|nr:50S ribosomal protein L6 [Cytophagales bacterium]
MSRVGGNPVLVPSGVEIRIEGRVLHVKGTKGGLSREIDPNIKVEKKDLSGSTHIVVSRPTDQKHHKALHGLYRSLIHGMVVGVSEGYVRELEVVGVGYKASVQKNILELHLGYSHPIYFVMPEEVKVSAETPKGRGGNNNPRIKLESIDKELVGKVAAKLRSLRKVEPYKGKGIRYLNEQVRRKAGKTAKK